MSTLNIERNSTVPFYIDKDLFERELHYTLHHIIENHVRDWRKRDKIYGYGEYVENLITPYLTNKREVFNCKVSHFREEHTFSIKFIITWSYVGEETLYNHINFTISPEDLLEPPKNYLHDVLDNVKLVG